jgi:hypothetical protein
MRHEFSGFITDILEKNYSKGGDAILDISPLLSYINIKTKSASRGSKSRGSFANLYAIYVLVEDYIEKGFTKRGDYSKYEGARYSDLFTRQRELPFGNKLQNHGLNSRLNEEFKKYFPTIEMPVIIRDLDSQKYWINESLLHVRINGKMVNIANSIIEIIDAYVNAKQDSFKKFIAQCDELASLSDKSGEASIFDFVGNLLEPNVDARLFEIVSYAILKAEYGTQTVWLGEEQDSVSEEVLELFKTGRTNANDGGIDFVMRPLGRFFQVTESLDLHKYFLDIDKVQHFPITFIIKTEDSIASILKYIEQGARQRFPVDSVVKKYMDSIEEVINLPLLRTYLHKVISSKGASELINEISKQSRVEFNSVEVDDTIDEEG